MGDHTLDLHDLMEIINSLSDAVVVYDSELKVVLVNEKLYEYAGRDYTNLIGTNPEQWLKTGLISNTIVQKVLDSKNEVTGTIESNNRYYSSRCRPIFDKNGDVEYIVSTASSLNEINILQEMLRKQSEQNERYLREVQQLRKALLTDQYVYASEHMEQLLDTIKKVAMVDCNVLITGESGVGKDVVAHTIHMNSPRKDGPYFPVNIPAIPENLLEAELFGYEEGAFTGAAKNGKMGLFEVAKGGTILLDEIGDMSYNMQVKILRAIENGEIMRIGATRPKKLDVRILAATNRNIQDAVAKGEFRSDLYYRLNVVTIYIKPLRERRGDIQGLCQHFLNQFNEKYGQQKRFDVNAFNEMEAYSWPGNVRELKNTIERLSILSEENFISIGDVRRILDMKGQARQNIREHYQNNYEKEGVGQQLADRSIQGLFDDYKKQRVLDVLKKTNGNKTEAAHLLGISRGKLYRLLQK